MRRIISVFVAAGLLVLALAGGSVALAAPSDGRGIPGAAEDPSPGRPNDPNAWGAVTSQFASNTADDTTLGQHASEPVPDPDESEDRGGRGAHDTPRLGVGNVARNDGGTGDTPSDHACVVGPFFGSNCTGDPGPLP